MALFKIHKGTEKNSDGTSKLPQSYVEGYAYFATDTGRFYIDTTDQSSGRKLINPDAITNITRNGTTFTATKVDGSTITFTQQDNNTTYSAGTGISLSGTTFSLNVAGAKTALGLGSNAYSSTAYLPLTGGTLTAASGGATPLTLKSGTGTASSYLKFVNANDTILGWIGFQSQDGPVISYGTTSKDYFILHKGNYSSYALPLSGGTLTGNLTLSTTSTGDSPSIIFNRGSSNDAYTDWRIIDSAGALRFGVRINANDFTNKIIFDENGNITASSFIGNLSGIATKAEKSYLTYNDSKVYYYSFGGAQDLNWKKVASIIYTSNASYVGATIKGIVYHTVGNYNQAEVREYNFQVNNTFTTGNDTIVDSCIFRKSPGCPDIIRVVKINTNNYELQVRQLQDWQKIAIQFTISSTNLIVPCDPVNSSNNSAISVSDLSDSHSLYSEYAFRVKDIGDNRNITFNYSADGMANSAVTWIAAWNGNTLQRINKNNLTVGSAATATTATIASSSNWLNTNSALTYGASGLNYFNASLGTTASASSNYAPTADWYHIIRMNHANTGGYYVDLAACFHSDNLYIKRVAAGTNHGYKHIWVEGNSVTSAVWNDYAEYRESDCAEFGRVLAENGDDTLSVTIERLQHFAGISSDTWGFCQGETERAKTPIAVAGRVLAYTYRDRNEYKPGDCVCAAPDGTVDIMTREEVERYPDRIVGTVSCVPEYEEWGSGDRPAVKVNGRIWIKVR